MASHLAGTLDESDDCRLVVHVRDCDDCFALLRRLRIELGVAADAALDRLRRR